MKSISQTYFMSEHKTQNLQQLKIGFAHLCVFALQYT